MRTLEEYVIGMRSNYESSFGINKSSIFDRYSEGFSHILYIFHSFSSLVIFDMPDSIPHRWRRPLHNDEEEGNDRSAAAEIY